ncbi:hypothetical protein EJ07DRAFT_159436 [Lizonia empirigonia]|nr:hypothetical protein EJ07DRAFT_159436 [Lizonia empirigonia]
MCFGQGDRKVHDTSTSAPPRASRPQYAHVRQRRAGGSANDSVRVLVQELHRENGDIERTYSRLPHESTVSADEDTFVIKKRELKYDGCSSTDDGSREVTRRQKGSTGQSGSSRPTVEGIQVTSELRTQTTTSSRKSRSSRRRQDNLIPMRDADRLSADQTNSSSQSITPVRSRLTRCLRKPQSKIQLDVPQEGGSNQQCIQTPPSLLAQASGRKQEKAASAITPGQPTVSLPAETSYAQNEPMVPDGTLEPEQTASVFRQPGMTRPQSDAFVFDGVLSTGREGLLKAGLVDSALSDPMTAQRVSPC